MDEITSNEIFKELAVKASQLLESGRYMVYKITTKASSSPLLLKLSKDKRTSLLLRNDFLWTTQVNKQLPRQKSFYIPKMINSGFYKNTYFWLLSEYIEHTPFAIIKDNIAIMNIKHPKKYIGQVVELIGALQEIKIIGLRNIDNRYSRLKDSQKLMVLEEAIQRGSGIIPFYAELLQIIESNFRELKKATVHGDLTPKNIMIDKKDRIVLADAELGGLNYYRYYDAVEFYMRLYTRCCRPDLAQYFFDAFRNKLHGNESKRFVKQFLALLALRCIANYSEIEKLSNMNKKKRFEYAGRLTEDIVTYKIIL